jgi:two-component system phosphate regulon sensor histidine kinase PhoR
MAAVIGSLLYLLRIIREQKQLAEIKNDFISNMTHEFKTPIATIGVALESIQHFNTSNDPEKTKKYIDMSSQQIGKLNVMVEKLLDTATLDRDALALDKQESNLADLLEGIYQKYRQTYEEKIITYESNADQVRASIDAFHVENAIDNIIDNAVKYGGETIDIKLGKAKKAVLITIKDSGQTLTKPQVSQIFEKFYRVPKGNTHDVKGFGIGLYYTKTIIEKHEGTISVTTSPTTFKITLPYA